MAQAEVRYKGISDVRRLSRKDLAQHGVTVDRDLVWDRSNGFKLQLELNDNFERLLRDQGHFTISEVKDSGDTGTMVAEAEDADNPGDIIEDSTTGQRTTGRRRR